MIGHGEVRLMPGQARYLDLRKDPGSFGMGTPGTADPPGERQEIRASWRVADPPGELPTCTRMRFIATVEVFGSNGATVFLYPGLGDPPTELTPLR